MSLEAGVELSGTRGSVEARLVVRWRHRIAGERASEPSRASVELLVATPGAHARSSWSGKVPWTRINGPLTSVVAGGHLPLAYRPSAVSVRGDRARWVPGASGCLHPGVLWCSAGWQVAGLRARERDVERVRSEPMATSARLLRDPFVPAVFSAVNGTRRWSHSVREAKGHERAAAVVHPIKASSRTQDRVDRKRSRREYPTNTGARFASRALCSPSQRDERRLCRR
jgi:hypothetical protein